MKFYSYSMPVLDEITMCTIISYDPSTGFEVHLDEYDKTGFLMNKDLSAKKIKKNISSFLKVGTQLPLYVLEIDNTDIIMSLKDVKNGDKECKERFSLNEKLFSLSRRLSHITDFPEERWDELFRTYQNIDDDYHLYTILSNPNNNPFKLDDSEYSELIKKNHVKLFGIHPLVFSYPVTIQALGIDGAEYVKNILINIRDTYNKPDKNTTICWTNEELYSNRDAVNLVILPLAIPTFQFQITVYHKNLLSGVIDNIKQMLNNGNFDFLDTTSFDNL